MYSAKVNWFIKISPSCILAGNTCIRFSDYSFSSRAVFCIFKSVILVILGEILSFDFYLVNSECGASPAVDHSLVFGSYPKMFLLFFGSSLIPVLKQFPWFISRFCFRYVFCSWIYWDLVTKFSQLVKLVYPFLIPSEINATQSKPKGDCNITFCSCGKIVITCLKCSRASFLLSSYSKKMPREQSLN